MCKDNVIDTVSPKDVYELPDLCEDCGGIPSTKDDDEWNILVLQIPKFYYEQHGDCSCHDEPSSKRTPGQIATQWENMGKDTEAPPDEPIGHDYHRELHEYLVEKGEREE